jgi:hypothetical protein
MLVKHVGVDMDVNSMFNDTIDRILKWSLRRRIMIQLKYDITFMSSVVLVSVSQIVLVLLS